MMPCYGNFSRQVICLIFCRIVSGCFYDTINEVFNKNGGDVTVFVTGINAQTTLKLFEECQEVYVFGAVDCRRSYDRGVEGQLLSIS